MEEKKRVYFIGDGLFKDTSTRLDVIEILTYEFEEEIRLLKSDIIPKIEYHELLDDKREYLKTIINELKQKVLNDVKSEKFRLIYKEVNEIEIWNSIERVFKPIIKKLDFIEYLFYVNYDIRIYGDGFEDENDNIFLDDDMSLPTGYNSMYDYIHSIFVEKDFSLETLANYNLYCELVETYNNLLSKEDIAEIDTGESHEGKIMVIKKIIILNELGIIDKIDDKIYRETKVYNYQKLSEEIATILGENLSTVKGIIYPLMKNQTDNSSYPTFAEKNKTFQKKLKELLNNS